MFKRWYDIDPAVSAAIKRLEDSPEQLQVRCADFIIKCLSCAIRFSLLWAQAPHKIKTIGLSLAEIARRAGIAKSTLSRVIKPPTSLTRIVLGSVSTAPIETRKHIRMIGSMSII